MQETNEAACLYELHSQAFPTLRFEAGATAKKGSGLIEVVVSLS
jgi:hypothetical protein